MALAALVAALPAQLNAVDGVLEINQACAATGCFPGDAPGFPVTIDRDQTASYRLTSNLVNRDVDVSTIQIQDDHVTLDLNGFAVSGPTVCTGMGFGLSCAPGGMSSGISGFGAVDPGGIVVKNGVVRGSPSDGIYLPGSENRVEGVHVVSNAGGGITAGGSTVVVGCRVIRNGSIGIGVSSRSMLRGNVVVGNELFGALLSVRSTAVAKNVIHGNGVAFEANGGGGTIVDNAVTHNDNLVVLSLGEGYAGNVFRGNGFGNQVSGGVEIGPNLCGTNTTCP